MTPPAKARRLGTVCLCLFAGLLVAGWWPFNFFARNQVNWLSGQSGVHLDQYGEIYSPGVWPAGKAISEQGVSVEFWVRGDADYDTLSPLVFFGSPVCTGNFVIAQSLSDLVVEGQFLDGTGQVRRHKLWINGAFAQGQPRFLTLVSGTQGTTVYLNGDVVNTYPNLALAVGDSSARLLLGHAADGQEEWSGDLLGLAFYTRALTGNEVAANYSAWREGKTAELAKQAAALYAFDERGGRVVHDGSGRMPDLVIPEEFRVLHDTPLEVPAKLRLSDLQDAAVNILGFIPFGFLLAAYLQQVTNWTRGRAVLFTVMAGLITSLLIELLQVYLPSRDSSLLDVINNSLGSALGALIPANAATRVPLVKFLGVDTHPLKQQA